MVYLYNVSKKSHYSLLITHYSEYKHPLSVDFNISVAFRLTSEFFLYDLLGLGLLLLCKHHVAKFIIARRSSRSPISVNVNNHVS